MTRPAIGSKEVEALLREVLGGSKQLALADPDITWNDVGSGDVTFLVAGWSLTFFNDCGDLDYLDSAQAPDGRTAKFEDWEAWGSRNPVDLLNNDDLHSLRRLLESLT